MKGISPLIASVLLIAFTMSIAGIMATWATTFSEKSLAKSQSCYGALEIIEIGFSDGNISVRLANNNNKMNLSDMKASIIYEDVKKNIDNLIIKNYGARDPLGPVESTTFIINLTEKTQPVKIEIIATKECPGVRIPKMF